MKRTKNTKKKSTFRVQEGGNLWLVVKAAIVSTMEIDIQVPGADPEIYLGGGVPYIGEGSEDRLLETILMTAENVFKKDIRNI